MSLEVAAHAGCPVVVARGELHVPDRRPVVVGVDDAPEARLAVRFAFEEAAIRGVGLVAVRACSARAGPTAGETGGGPEQPPDAAQRLVAEAVTRWQDRYPSVDVTSRLMPVTATHALMLASHEGQLVVVGSRGSGGLAGLPLGAVK